MKINHHITTIFALALAVLSCNPPKDSEVRTLRYYPDGRDFVCLNGAGRYTRPLYGTHSRFRLETSDRPVFACYDKLNSWNFRFYLSYKGSELQLDQTAYAEARYQGGRRTYILRDPSWGEGAELEVWAMASFFEEGAVWRFTPKGFSEGVEMKAKMCRIAGTSFYRDGDLGTDDRAIFEPSEDEKDLQTIEWDGSSESYCVYTHGVGLKSLSAEEGYEGFAREQKAQEELAGTIEINTPDPFINTLGSAIVAAADGTWDGTTFLHGANGWRTPYAGWRGAYAGDVVGWGERAVSHFRAYSKSMVTEVPPIYPQPQQDTLNNLARATEKWGTPIYSNGYICKLPGRANQTSHYDMNLNYIDELLTHFCYDADTSFIREMWPYIRLHHEWEKRNFDPDGDHLYDAYCCIWASDALYYSGGAVTHSSAYNYRGNLLTAKLAELIGEDPTPYREEAEGILKALNERLWMEDLGYWAEYEDLMGLKRLHKSAAVWTIYTPIDCEAATREQAYRATLYVDRSIPHIPVLYKYDKKALKGLALSLPRPERDLQTVSTSDWLPYVWSTNNVAHEEVANTALAFLQAGRREAGFKLLKADLMDEMYLGKCPGNFGQISHYDKSRNEEYRDFADNVGISSRAIVNGLFGILPDALEGRCVISQSFPKGWKEASIKTPYLSYSYERRGGQDIYTVEQNFTKPLKIVIRASAEGGDYIEVEGSAEKVQTIVVGRRDIPKAKRQPKIESTRSLSTSKKYLEAMGLGDITERSAKTMVDISAGFNSNVDDIFRNSYLSPRPPYSSLELPTQGIGEWCIPHETAQIEDDGLRALSQDGVFDTGLGLSFLTPKEGHNIIYTSLWDNYPDSVSVPLGGKARSAYLLMAGSTQNMQSRIDNAVVTVSYTDGSKSTMSIENPTNWRPIQQDYYTDDYAFWTAGAKPYRVLLSSGKVGREILSDFAAAPENDKSYKSGLKLTDRIIPDGAALILKMPLNPDLELKDLTLRTLSNDVVIGLMAVSLEK